MCSSSNWSSIARRFCSHRRNVDMGRAAKNPWLVERFYPDGIGKAEAQIPTSTINAVALRTVGFAKLKRRLNIQDRAQQLIQLSTIHYLRGRSGSLSTGLKIAAFCNKGQSIGRKCDKMTGTTLKNEALPSESWRQHLSRLY